MNDIDENRWNVFEAFCLLGNTILLMMQCAMIMNTLPALAFYEFGSHRFTPSLSLSAKK